MIVNENKELLIKSLGLKFERHLIKTHVIMPDDTWKDIVDTYVRPNIIEDDVVFIAESIIAIIQGRAIPLADISPRPLAHLLSKFVTKNPGGIGLTDPRMMEMAIQEAGTPRMLWAAFRSALGKLTGKSGVFYKIAGANVRDIDGPDEYTIPPYNEYVVLAPTNPQKFAEKISEYLGVGVAIVDINDLGQNVLGNKSNYLNYEIEDILRDNPLGQSDEQTPVGIIRREHIKELKEAYNELSKNVSEDIATSDKTLLTKEEYTLLKAVKSDITHIAKDKQGHIKLYYGKPQWTGNKWENAPSVSIHYYDFNSFNRLSFEDSPYLIEDLVMEYIEFEAGELFEEKQ